MSKKLKILITGSNGFIAKNLILKLEHEGTFEILRFVRSNKITHLKNLLSQTDILIHLAGENRPKNFSDFHSGNANFTKIISTLLLELKLNIPCIFASSTHAEIFKSLKPRNNPLYYYGKSKKNAEDILIKACERLGSSLHIYRLPGVFGKWSKPNYNSVVSTFCYNIARKRPIEISNSDTSIDLVYIDDVIESFIKKIKKPIKGHSFVQIKKTYTITLGRLSKLINNFSNSRFTLDAGNVGSGIQRALYATYLSYLPSNNFSYQLNDHADERGSFVEFIKTSNSGQFSLATFAPGISRGEHYHHTKNEKFIALNGKAIFTFRNLNDNKMVKISTENHNEVVMSIPGWVHKITNPNSFELYMLIWSNEVFDQNKPDTYNSTIEI